MHPNNQVPLGLPDDYHDMVKWKAVAMLHGFDDALEQVQFASTQYAIHFNNLKRLYLPPVELAPAFGADDYERYDRGTFFGRGYLS